MTYEQKREAFEALAVQLSTLTLERDEAGRYVSAVQQMLWESFQVRRATAPAPEAEPAQTQQAEPVAWRYKYKFRDIGETGAYEYHSHDFACVARLPKGEPLYTHPSEAKPEAQQTPEPIGVATVYKYHTDAQGEVAGECWNAAGVSFKDGVLDSLKPGDKLELYGLVKKAHCIGTKPDAQQPLTPQ